MEKFVDNKEAIKALLKQGKFVVSGRATGKTSALAEILFEDAYSVVVVPTFAGYNRLLDIYAEKYGTPPKDYRRRVFIGTTEAELKMKGFVVPSKHNIYVDEYHVNLYNGPFYAAVTSFPFSSQIVVLL